MSRGSGDRGPIYTGPDPEVSVITLPNGQPLPPYWTFVLIDREVRLYTNSSLTTPYVLGMSNYNLGINSQVKFLDQYTTELRDGKQVVKSMYVEWDNEGTKYNVWIDAFVKYSQTPADQYPDGYGNTGGTSPKPIPQPVQDMPVQARTKNTVWLMLALLLLIFSSKRKKR